MVGVDNKFQITEEKCGTCNRKLIIDRNGHYVCLKCERMHSCLKIVPKNPNWHRDKSE